jgi:hypothetical protein
MKKMTSLKVLKTTMQYRLERERESRYANGLGILELDRNRCELKTERSLTGKALSSSASGMLERASVIGRNGDLYLQITEYISHGNCFYI